MDFYFLLFIKKGIFTDSNTPIKILVTVQSRIYGNIF